MKYLFAVALISLGLSTAALSANNSRTDFPDQLCRARRIYVAGLGDSNEAERFRRELQRQLKRRRFTLASKADEADGLLTGKFSFTGSDRNGKLVFDPAELRDATGALLWHSSFYFTRRGRASFLSGGNIKDAAEKVAATLKGACQ